MGKLLNFSWKSFALGLVYLEFGGTFALPIGQSGWPHREEQRNGLKNKFKKVLQVKKKLLPLHSQTIREGKIGREEVENKEDRLRCSTVITSSRYAVG